MQTLFDRYLVYSYAGLYGISSRIMTDDQIPPETGSFEEQIASELEQGEQEVKKHAQPAAQGDQEVSLRNARDVVLKFRPVPQVIWRFVNYSIGRSGQFKPIPEGMLFGLKKLVLGISKDPVLGSGKPYLTIKGAVDNIKGDIIAASSVIHAVSRRLKTFDFATVWGPILDDAILRANIGFYIGAICTDFGSGRSMLAGFAGRVGLAALIATGNEEQAGAAIKALSMGGNIRDVAFDVYVTDPMFVSAMILSAAGCGRDAISGIAAFSQPLSKDFEMNIHQKRWLATLKVTDEARMGDLGNVPQEMWTAIEYDAAEIKELADIVQGLKKKGHPWKWLTQ